MQKPLTRRQTTEDSEDEADDERYEQGRIETKKGVEVSVIQDICNSPWHMGFLMRYSVSHDIKVCYTVLSSCYFNTVMLS